MNIIYSISHNLLMGSMVLVSPLSRVSAYSLNRGCNSQRFIAISFCKIALKIKKPYMNSQPNLLFKSFFFIGKIKLQTYKFTFIRLQPPRHRWLLFQVTIWYMIISSQLKSLGNTWYTSLDQFLKRNTIWIFSSLNRIKDLLCNITQQSAYL